MLDELTLPADYSVTIRDSKGDIIASRTPSGAAEQVSGDTGGSRFEARSIVSQWSVVFAVPYSIYRQPLVSTGLVLALTIFCTALVGIAAGRILGGKLARAMTSLAGGAAALPGELVIDEIEGVRALLAETEAARLQSEEKVRQSEVMYRSVFEAANVGKSITLPSGEIRANKAFSEMLGYSREELQGTIWQELTHPDDIEVNDRALGALLQGDRDSTRFTKRYIHKDGSPVWADVSVALRRDANGLPLHFIATIVDVTERHRIEKQLESTLDYIQAILENAPIGIATFAADGRIITTNSALAKIVGGTVEQILHLNIHDITSWQTSGMLAAAEEVLQNGVGQDLEFQYISSFGKECWVSALFMPFLHAGERQLLLLLTDIFEHRKAEEERAKLQAQLLQSQKIEAVGQLAGGVAHDYNNALSVILGYTELALEQVDPSSPLHADLNEVLAAGKRSAELTRQLLAFARKQLISPVVLDLNSTIAGLLKMLRHLLGENIELTFLPADDLWSLKLDPSQIDQLLVNLCVNARDAISDVGAITIETNNVTLDQEFCSHHAGFLPGHFVLLQVSDNGCGMEKETQERIFEPFYTTKGLGKGTGLGLSTVYGIVKQNGGFINVYSEPGKGTTLKIYLLRHLGPDEAVSQGALEHCPAGHGETVLLVEDETSILDLGRRMLEGLGYTVLSADSPEKGISIAEEYRGDIDLLLTDVIMPGMNGRDLAERVRALHPGIRALYMSGYTANVIAHHGVLDAGVNFVAKPFSLQSLAVKVCSALS